MCYDITNYDSFQNLDDWYRLVVKTFAKGTMPYISMVGNKCKIASSLLLLSILLIVSYSYEYCSLYRTKSLELPTSVWKRKCIYCVRGSHMAVKH